VKAITTAVVLEAAGIDRFRPLLDEAQWRTLTRTMTDFEHAMRGRRLWNVNSTARGGGVAELLSSLIPYDLGSGIDERWVVIDASPAFFNVTKRLHNLLHGVDANGMAIGDEERREYESTLEANAAALEKEMRPGDVALLHDPQTTGLAPALAQRGVVVVWRCHIGVDEPNAAVRSAWRILEPYLADARAYIFTRATYAWDGLDPRRVHVIPPTIDPFSVKNRDIPDGDVAAILEAAGITRGPSSSEPGRRFEQQAVVTGEPLAPDSRIVMQVSRWDTLKDPLGVLEGFVQSVAPATDAKLVLAGPAVSGVDDDPEQPQVLDVVMRHRESLPRKVRGRVAIVQLPMVDIDENATMVNALQRRSDVVVQKSLAEGFGLTVAEAMWKGRPIVASRVGGIEDQVVNGESGLLVDDPADLVAFGGAVTELLTHPARAVELGGGARRRAIAQFLAPRALVDQARLIMSLVPAA
jgi:trehalose synthase